MQCTIYIVSQIYVSNKYIYIYDIQVYIHTCIYIHTFMYIYIYVYRDTVVLFSEKLHCFYQKTEWGDPIENWSVCEFQILSVDNCEIML